MYSVVSDKTLILYSLLFVVQQFTHHHYARNFLLYVFCTFCMFLIIIFDSINKQTTKQNSNTYFSFASFIKLPLFRVVKWKSKRCLLVYGNTKNHSSITVETFVGLFCYSYFFSDVIMQIFPYQMLTLFLFLFLCCVTLWSWRSCYCEAK